MATKKKTNTKPDRVDELVERQRRLLKEAQDAGAKAGNDLRAAKRQAHIDLDNSGGRVPAHAERWAELSQQIQRDKVESMERLAALDDDDFAEVVLAELDRRRLDANGNQTDPPGLYNATATGLLALVGELSEQDAALAERVAAVGRGVEIRSADSDNAPVLREISTWLDTDWSRIKDRAGSLAKTLQKRLGRHVDRQQIANALDVQGKRKRLAAVAFAAGLRAADGEPIGENAIKSALKKR